MTNPSPVKPIARAARFALRRFAGAMLLAMIAIGLPGCGSSEPTPEELLSRKAKKLEIERLSKPESEEELLNDARKELKLGNYSRVETITRQLLVSHPENREAILLAAKAQAAAGDKLSAAKTLESIADDDPQQGQPARSLAADWLTEAGKPEQAVDQWQRLLKVHGENDRARHQLARLLNNLGRRMEAEEQLQVLVRSGDISEKELFSMIKLASPFIDESMPKPDFQGALTPAALAQAKVFRVNNQLQESLRLTERLNKQFPQSTQISAFLARLYCDLHDDASLTRWLAETPDDIEREPEYWHATGMLFQRQGQHELAIRCFGEAVSRDQTDRLSYLGLGRSLSLHGDEQAAARVIGRYELVDETARLSGKFGRAPGTIEELYRMADLLDELQRPWEAIAWRSIAARTADAPETQLAALREQRQALSRQGHSPPELWRTCGIDLADWPLPSIEKIESPANRPTRRGPLIADRSIRMTDVAKGVGLPFRYRNGDDMGDDRFFLHQQTGGGIGIIDYDLDGWPDCYFTQAGGPAMDATASGPNQLMRNVAGTSFLNVTQQTGTGDRGYGQGVATADINQDGFPDLVVANIGRNVLLINNGDGTFAQRSLPTAGGDQWTTSIACGDLSGDNLPEIVDVNYIDDEDAFRIPCTHETDICNPSRFRPAADRILTVSPDGGVEPWDAGPDLQSERGHGFAAVIADIDGQSGNDLFVANDSTRNRYWQSRTTSEPDGSLESGQRGLVEMATLLGCASGVHGTRQGCMGVASGDFDRNGQLDLHVTNFWNQPADLYLQQSGAMFSNASLAFGLGESSFKTVGWGTQAVDLDRDGWLDMAVMNGHIVDHSQRGIPYRMRPQLYRGGPTRFELVSSPEAGPFWTTKTLGRTLAVVDFNRDGRPDLIANHLDEPVTLLANETETQNGIQLELIGTTSERDAVGAEIRLRAGSDEWTQWVVGGDGLLCSNEALVDVGIGSYEQAAEIQITWPSGQTQVFEALPANHRYLAVEGAEALFVR